MQHELSIYTDRWHGGRQLFCRLLAEEFAHIVSCKISVYYHLKIRIYYESKICTYYELENSHILHAEEEGADVSLVYYFQILLLPSSSSDVHTFII